MDNYILEGILMPIDENFVNVVQIFLDKNQKTKIRAQNVRQYAEGIIDLLLKDEITPFLKDTENYESINWGRKIKYIKENYDITIGEKLEEIFKIGGNASHFNGIISKEDAKNIISKAVHIVEDIFVKYFTSKEHEFGTENILTIFSMLPLSNRIYILENVFLTLKTDAVIDRLSLAYAKNNLLNKANDILDESLSNEIITEQFCNYQKGKINRILENIDTVNKLNTDYQDTGCIKMIESTHGFIVGLPTNKNIFETKDSVTFFENWITEERAKYPKFINLFLYLMQTCAR